ncbi:MAG: response regulator transcription factor [Rhodospirillales bacterium]|jgi:two-component system, LuxR family, response regulator FixJ|nr:response regulator transcription factor [Rhodospirillales bacterium]
MKIYLVEDDKDLAQTIATAMQVEGIEAEIYFSAESFIEQYSSNFVGCVLLDVKLPGMSGIELQTWLLDMGCDLPIIFITGYGEIPDVVQAVRMGAVDFIEKPFSMSSLMEVLGNAFDLLEEYQENLNRISVLTSRERNVFDLLIEGKSNKLVARELEIGLRTVEFHRKNILEKLDVGSVSGLVEISRSLPASR